MPAATMIACPRIGDAQIGMCQSTTAVKAARVLFAHAIPQYSVPTVIVSDSEPAFKPVSSPHHHSKVERRVAPYTRAIETAMAVGTKACSCTMKVVMASTLITQTQLAVTYGTTAVTRRTGATCTVAGGS